jgi:hypothetical protein
MNTPHAEAAEVITVSLVCVWCPPDIANVGILYYHVNIILFVIAMKRVHTQEKFARIPFPHCLRKQRANELKGTACLPAFSEKTANE